MTYSELQHYSDFEGSLTDTWPDFVVGSPTLLADKRLTNNAFRVLCALLSHFNRTKAVETEARIGPIRADDFDMASFKALDGVIFLRLATLESETGLSESAVSRAITRLVAHGFVERKVDVTSDGKSFRSLNYFWIPAKYGNVSRNEGFIVPKTALAKSKGTLSGAAVRALAAFGSLVTWESAGIGTKEPQLAALLGISERSIRSAMAEIVEVGYLRRFRNGEGRGANYHYHLSNPSERFDEGFFNQEETEYAFCD